MHATCTKQKVNIFLMKNIANLLVTVEQLKKYKVTDAYNKVGKLLYIKTCIDTILSTEMNMQINRYMSFNSINSETHLFNWSSRITYRV